MLYTTFIRLCDEAVKYTASEEFIMSLGWQSWMDSTSEDEIINDLSLIFELSNLDFRGMRKRLNISMAKMSVMYRIPLRTIENWENSVKKQANYVSDLLRFTIFVREREGDDGYIDYIEKQN